MSRKVNNILSVICSFVKFSIIKIFHFKDVHIGIIERFSPNVVVEIDKKGRLYIGKKVRAHSGCKFKVRKNSELNIGNGVSFNYNCMVFCHEKIEIKDGVEFGPNVLIYDHDHDYKNKGGIKTGKFTTAPVFIGENTWIGANSVILKGSKIGSNCVVAAGSIVKGTIEDNQLFVQKREMQIKKIEKN